MDQVPVSVPRSTVTGRLIFAGYRAILVRIETDEGVTGVGEGLSRLAPRAGAAIIDELRPLLIGRDPMALDVLWEDLFATMSNRGHNRGFMLEAISAIDIALWDIAAKSVGMPTYALLGGAHATEIPCYASSVRIKAPEEAAADACALVEEGFDAIKLKVGRGKGRIGEDIDAINAVREAIGPDRGLMVDANCGYELAEATALGRELEHLGVAWFEEPLSPDDLQGYRELKRRIAVPIAAGETWFTRYDFRSALVTDAVDIVQPDVSRCGGLSEARKIAWLASAFHKQFAPHTGQSSIVCLMASLHLAASVPNTLTYEFVTADWSARNANPLRVSLASPTMESLRTGSRVRLPAGPGHGIELDWETVMDYVQ